MSQVKRLVNREIFAKRDTIIGTVISAVELRNFDAGNNETWVASIAIGPEGFLLDVPIKSVNRSRFFAQLGASVLLKRNAQGRWDVVGPADRVNTPAVKKSYNMNTGATISTSTVGYTVTPVPFNYYQGAVRLTDNAALTFDQIPAANDELIRSTGSWVADGFAISDVIRVQGSVLNDGTYTVIDITTDTNPFDTLEFTGDVFTDEGPTAGISVAINGASLWNDTVTPFPLTRVVDGDGVQVLP
jgi:hypothetical protein